MLDEIDGCPLDQESQDDLAKIFASCADAQLRAPLMMRVKDTTKLAVSVLDAFEQTHEVDPETNTWIRKLLLRLHGGGVVAPKWGNDDD